VARRTTKKLTCPACATIVAEATYQRLPSKLVVTSLDGVVIAPTGVGLLIRLAERELAAAHPASRRTRPGPGSRGSGTTSAS
jgi:hypothetical protein